MSVIEKNRLPKLSFTLRMLHKISNSDKTTLHSFESYLLYRKVQHDTAFTSFDYFHDEVIVVNWQFLSEIQQL